MSILSELNTIFGELGIPAESGIFKGKAPDKYVVLVPISDDFALHGDNLPTVEVSEVRISLYSKGNYTADKNRIVRKLLSEEFTITSRLYNGFETETGYHHYTVDVAKHYQFTQEE